MEPTRLIDDGGFEKELLEAARRDGPPEGALLRSAALFGLVTSSASIAATTAGTASAASAKATSAVLGSASLAKWLGIGAAVGLVTTSGARIVSDPEILNALAPRKAPVVNAPMSTASRRSDATESPRTPAGDTREVPQQE